MRVFTLPIDGGAMCWRKAVWVNSTHDISDFSAFNSGIFDSPSLRFIGMDEQRKDMETYAEAAARLLAGLDERAQKASGGLNQPEQIPTGSVRVPARADEADGGQSQGVAANCNHRPHYVAGGHDGEGQAATDKALSSPIARRNPAPDGVEGPLSRGSK